jgi:hypothetical protein
MKRLRRLFTPPEVYDLSALAGLLLLSVGLWCIYPPLALIVTGAALLFLGLCGAKSWTNENESKSSRRRQDRV